MSTRIFVSLPVADLARSVAFYEAMGARRDPRLSDAETACMAFSDAISVMLLTRPRFAGFAARPVADARAACQVLLCLTAESRDAVDAAAAAAGRMGGAADPSPPHDGPAMYGRAVEDPDGHLVQFMWMDAAASSDPPA